MSQLFAPLARSLLTAIVIGTTCGAFADQLTQEQKTRASTLRVISDRAGGRWENPNYPTIVTLSAEKPRQKDLDLLRSGATGTYTERTKGGEAFGAGTWQLDEHGRGNLAWQPGGKSLAILVADNVLALQPFTRTGGLYGDGLVLFRAKFDFEGLETQAILSTEAHQNRINGRWTHANLDRLHEVTKEGLWLERRKNGGIHSQGIWRIHDDGTYVVRLDNKWRFRVWPVSHDKIVIVWFAPDGAMDKDGAILNRE